LDIPDNWRDPYNETAFHRGDGEYYNAYADPYVVLPCVVGINKIDNTTGYDHGDSALVINWDTGQFIWCEIGDRGFKSDGWGEVSLYVIWQTGYPNHMTGNHADGISDNYEIILYHGKVY